MELDCFGSTQDYMGNNLHSKHNENINQAGEFLHSYQIEKFEEIRNMQQRTKGGYLNNYLIYPNLTELE